jgi:hypothetical protein
MDFSLEQAVVHSCEVVIFPGCLLNDIHNESVLYSPPPVLVESAQIAQTMLVF